MNNYDYLKDVSLTFSRKRAIISEFLVADFSSSCVVV